MARPEKYDDLRPFEKTSFDLVTLEQTDYTQLPFEVARALLDLLEVAEEYGYSVKKHGRVNRTPSSSDKLVDLKKAQERWDDSFAEWEKALAYPGSVDRWRRSPVKHFAEDNGLEVPNFES